MRHICRIRSGFHSLGQRGEGKMTEKPVSVTCSPLLALAGLVDALAAVASLHVHG